MLYEHNQQPYNNIVNTIKENNCACLIMGTGVGKSYITLEYLEQHNYTALIVSPRNSINNSWEKLCGNRVDTITYQKLANIYKTIDFSKYDLVICDEVHHIGAVKWGEPIRYLLNNNVKVLGLTESSIRYSDGGRDIGIEFFGNNKVYGESVSSAIEKGILNPVTYVGAMYNSEGLKKTLRGKIQSRLYAKLNLAINKTPMVNEIIKKNMPNGKRKGIIFASTIYDMNYAVDFMHSVYPNATIKKVHSKQSDAINEENIEWFKNTDEGYLCSVDMISEGVHIKGVNTLVMLRRTESVNLFNQQLGRCLDANSKEPAILFDLVNNKYSIRIVKNKLRIKLNSMFGSSALNVIPSQQLIVKDYTKDIVDVLNEIKESLDKKWTSQEVDIMFKYYKNKSKQELQKLLPNHTALAIERKAGYLGLSNAGLWTKEEVEIIKKYFLKDRKKCFRLLPNRSEQAISSKASRLKLAFDNNFYTKKEEKIIALYANKGSKKIIEILKKNGFRERDANSIRAKAKKLGVKVKSYKSIRCVETGVIYASCLDVEKKTGFRNGLISACVRGKRKTGYGYHWEYVEE